MTSRLLRRPSLALAYAMKLPTASARRGLGSGRTDHKLTLLVSKSVAGTDADFNASLLVNGVPGRARRVAGSQFALSLSRDIARGLSVQAEVFGETIDTDQPPGRLFQAGLTYQPSRRVSLDLGGRVGLSANAPRSGLFGGVSISIANLYRS